ncbi:hypothetical protein CQR47_0568 [Bifidobacterium thermophilum]|uniref:Uncharacterized protein n=53 Tax=root TaxID=1 RepID=A0A2N3QM16_9BIFI|nr:hypothetical protein CQR47_0568 [Bifidobacterium thermophilum]
MAGDRTGAVLYDVPSSIPSSHTISRHHPRVSPTPSAHSRFEPNDEMSYTEKSGLIRGLIIQKGLIGFDGDLFVAGKRAENAESTRDALREQISAKSNRTEFALAA